MNWLSHLRKMFFEDSDGAIALDFLGGTVRESLGLDLEATKIVGDAWSYVKQAYDAVLSAGDQ